ncbi:3-isopropylmalate dehydratase small subunit [uncultured Brevundimonas sp.]|uniref:3-isopropylmalate dehydratase small subunit n=1 Tax=uncultured Brevundimonas sp. TaxID=213418 RepID=UPI0026099168|nr:3-isopropylmalate dehydratase small subunit [uncultured Brevundimonas sp.]
MKPFTRLVARAAPLPRANIDTDQILPKQFLKTVEREGLARGLFYDFRFDGQGRPRPDFVLNQPRYEEAGILIAGDNFGCGSSREHAPWALMDFGLRCVIAPGFAEIFYNNCFQNGLLPVVLPAGEVQALTREVLDSDRPMTVDLEAQTVTSPSGRVLRFDIDADRRQKMLEGLDAIDETLVLAAAIEAYERDHEPRPAGTP